MERILEVSWSGGSWTECLGSLLSRKGPDGEVGQALSPASIDDSFAQVFHRRVFVGKSCIARTHLKTWIWVPASSLLVGMTLEKGPCHVSRHSQVVGAHQPWDGVLSSSQG